MLMVDPHSPDLFLSSFPFGPVYVHTFYILIIQILHVYVDVDMTG